MKTRLVYNAQTFHQVLDELNPSKVIVLSDDHTHENCLPHFQTTYLIDRDAKLITIPHGESSKDISYVTDLWNRLLALGADRQSVLICLGGGVVTDLGGFIASTYKRGIRFIHVPTTLLAMTDAAIGGKNGINFGSFKNQIGATVLPECIVIDPVFLNTLSEDELKNGFVETLKHALISDENLWKDLEGGDPLILSKDLSIIKRSIAIKSAVVEEDPMEKGRRQILNFGHTIGHAIEATSELKHGEAVAFGMLAESFLSHKLNSLSLKDLNRIEKVIKSLAFDFDGKINQSNLLIEKMMQDKKNLNGQIRFCLLTNIGQAEFGIGIEREDIIKSITFAENALV